MGKLRHLLPCVLFLLEIFLFVLLVQSSGENQKRGIPIPCVDHLPCWLYCESFVEGQQGAGCCYDIQFKDKDKNAMISLPGLLSKGCYCCFCPKRIIPLNPALIDKFCNEINPVLDNVTELTSGVTNLLSNVCAANVVNNIECSLVQVHLDLSLVSLLSGCDSNSQGDGSLLDILG